MSPQLLIPLLRDDDLYLIERIVGVPWIPRVLATLAVLTAGIAVLQTPQPPNWAMAIIGGLTLIAFGKFLLLRNRVRRSLEKPVIARSLRFAAWGFWVPLDCSSWAQNAWFLVTVFSWIFAAAAVLRQS